ncbi:hypothetical protein QFC20_002821 [Naganishia adeliensis]|uniref:Uncharacterized protein n=1 Tax=Naganishia adeliensis TaxID=92952 RepID=A0ACC2WHG0_9TREE|nr:hypothetical protein QFC20_002821 [Naganishia adeliensis]
MDFSSVTSVSSSLSKQMLIIFSSFVYQSHESLEPQLLSIQDAQGPTSGDQSPEVGTVLHDSDSEDVSRSPSSEEVQVAKQQDEAAAYLLTQVEQPPILESPICQGCNRVPVDGNNSFCQSCKEFYLALQQQPELQSLLNQLSPVINSASNQPVANAYLHHTINGGVTRPLNLIPSSVYTCPRLQQTQATQFLPDQGGGQFSTTQPVQTAYPWPSTGVNISPLGYPTAFPQFPLSNFNSEATSQQYQAAQPLQIQGAELSPSFRSVIQTGYSGSLYLSAAEAPVCPVSEYTGSWLQQPGYLSTSVYQGRKPTHWKQPVLDVGFSLPSLVNDTQPLIDYSATMDREPDEANGEKPPRNRNVRCMEHRGEKYNRPIIDACVGCRLCSIASRVYQLLINRKKNPPYTRKNITNETEKLKRTKELELIAYLNGDDECHAQLERAQGTERYEDLMRRIEKAGGLLPALPWTKSA